MPYPVYCPWCGALPVRAACTDDGHVAKWRKGIPYDGVWGATDKNTEIPDTFGLTATS